jgi:tungstate transport system substrate-binding protein
MSRWLAPSFCTRSRCNAKHRNQVSPRVLIKRSLHRFIFLSLVLLTACAISTATSPCLLRLATTTSTYDSGLLAFILPDFEKQFNCKIDVIAVGTGQAIAIGQKGDADVVLVHDRLLEDQFVAEGYATGRWDVMYNDFILVGPQNDPAHAIGMRSAKEAFQAIAKSQANLASRGDKSGTHAKELSIWSSLGITPTQAMRWYNSLGQGMGDTLVFANEKPAYTLTDRATWLAMRARLPNLTIIVGGNTIAENPDKLLYNPYGVMPVNPAKHPSVNATAAMNFVRWITSPDTQKMIGHFGVEQYGSALFYPNAK